MGGCIKPIFIHCNKGFSDHEKYDSSGLLIELWVFGREKVGDFVRVALISFAGVSSIGCGFALSETMTIIILNTYLNRLLLQ